MSKRITITFDPTPEVERMLARAAKKGNRSKVINLALRVWLTQNGHARKKDVAP